MQLQAMTMWLGIGARFPCWRIAATIVAVGLPGVVGAQQPVARDFAAVERWLGSDQTERDGLEAAVKRAVGQPV